MKQLILLRHAEAAEKLPHQSDKDRELTSVGRNHAERVGAYLRRESFLPDVIISSDATRARSTSIIVAAKFNIEAEKIIFDSLLYEVGSTRVFLERISLIADTFRSVLLVGHNPIFSSMAEYFANHFPGASHQRVQS